MAMPIGHQSEVKTGNFGHFWAIFSDFQDFGDFGTLFDRFGHFGRFNRWHGFGPSVFFSPVFVTGFSPPGAGGGIPIPSDLAMG